VPRDWRDAVATSVALEPRPGAPGTPRGSPTWRAYGDGNILGKSMVNDGKMMGK